MGQARSSRSWRMASQEAGASVRVGPRAYPEDRTPLAMGDMIVMKHAEAGRERDTSEKL